MKERKWEEAVASEAEGEWVRGALNSRPSNKGATLLARATCENQPAEEEVRATSWATGTQGGKHGVGSPCGGQRPAPPPWIHASVSARSSALCPAWVVRTEHRPDVDWKMGPTGHTEAGSSPPALQVPGALFLALLGPFQP